MTTGPDAPLAATISTARLDLVLLDRAWLQAYVDQQPLPNRGFSDPEDFLGGSEYVVHMRAEQAAGDPAQEPWLLRAMVVREQAVAVGYVNFHAPPDERSMVEIGYQVLPAHRRRGYASEAAEGMWRWAAQHGAQVLRASISPTNEPSLAMIRGAGFTPVGEQLDERDGIEIVFERPV